MLAKSCVTAIKYWKAKQNILYFYLITVQLSGHAINIENFSLILKTLRISFEE